MNARVDAPIGDAAPGLRRVEVLRHTYSDHLPIAMEVALPAAEWWSGAPPAAAAASLP